MRRAVQFFFYLLFYSGYEGGGGEINEDAGKKLNFKINQFCIILIFDFFSPTTSTPL